MSIFQEKNSRVGVGKPKRSQHRNGRFQSCTKLREKVFSMEYWHLQNTSETRFTHIKQLPLPLCYVRLVDHFVSQSYIFPKMVNYSAKQ